MAKAATAATVPMPLDIAEARVIELITVENKHPSCTVQSSFMIKQ